MSRARLGSALLLALVLAGVTAGCSREPSSGGGPDGARERAPASIAVIGLDGLEWEILAPLLARGELPALAALVDRGVHGRLATLQPTLSPTIWTTVATGKLPEKHGILHFAMPEGPGRIRLFDRRHRRTKALWNMFSERGRSSTVIGWWMTFPVEPISGLMVAQTNTPAQFDTRGGRAIWRGTVVPGLAGQVHPPERQAAVLELARATAEDAPRRALELFGPFAHPMSALVERLWDNSLWAFRADLVNRAVALDSLASGEKPELFLLYFGGTDVVAHRFFRHRAPALFRHPPPAAEVEDFGPVIDDYYRWIDGVVGEVVAALGEDADVMVLSDHGMHAINQEREFPPDAVPADVNSGHHEDAPPGVLIAAGPRLRPAQAAASRTLDPAALPYLGSVLDVAPTVLALAGLPIGEDMDGVVLEALAAPGVLERNPVRRIASWDAVGEKPSAEGPALPADASEERLKQLRALGYVE